MTMKKWHAAAIAALFAAVSLAYPLLVYLALGRFEPRWISLLLAAVAALRALMARQPFWWALAAAATLLAALAFFANAAAPLKLYPLLVNVAMLGVFGASLVWPPSAIERIARLQRPDLPPSGVAWTRKVTQAWCGFFVCNGALALLTALFAPERIWALYNGLVAYVLMGAMFGGEWLLRRRAMRQADGSGAAHG